MDLQPTGAANNESTAVECDEASSRQQAVDADDNDDNPSKGVHACCECVSVERHAEPTNADWQNQTVDQAPFIASTTSRSSNTSNSNSRYDARKCTSGIPSPVLCDVCTYTCVCVCLNNSADAENKEGERVETVIYFTLLDSIYY